MSSDGGGEIRHIVDAYRKAFNQHGRSPASVLCPKGRHGLRFDALLAPVELEGRRLLDFGCGLGHLCDHLAERGIDCDYLGVDIVPDFIDSNRTAYPARCFELIGDIADIKGRFDVIVASGVFNLRYLDDAAANEAYVRSRIKQLFELCDDALSLDFMTSHVDFQRDDAFHADPGEMFSFAMREMGRRVVINHCYMPFEFCLTILKPDKIDRAASVYARS